jgi:hypothetical protein
MKRILLVGLVVAGLTVVGFSVPAFAHGPEATGTVTTNQGTWEAMYATCTSMARVITLLRRETRSLPITGVERGITWVVARQVVVGAV